MRYNYWTMRYLPDPARGEFVNIGLLVGQDGADWAVRTVHSFDRVSRLGGDLNVARHWSSNFREMVAANTDALAGIVISQGTINSLRGFHNNAVQLSAPLPVVAESAEAAIEVLYDRLVLEPAHSPRSTSHSRAVRTLGEAYGQLRPTLSLCKRVKVRAGRQSLDFDFALKGNRIEELSRVWSFDLKDMDPQVEKVQAWGFRLQELREGGGELTGEQQLAIDQDVPVKVLYVPPKTAAQRESLDLAQDAWKKVEAKAYPLDQARELARSA